MKRTVTFDTDAPPSKKQKLDTNANTPPNLNDNTHSEYPTIPIDGNNLLSILLHPLDKETFMKQYWTKKSYHISIDNQTRVHDLLNGPFPFHLKTLLQETASQKIHVWMKSNQTNKNTDASNLLSFTVDDYDSALSCYHCGGSLYFRSSQELADIFIPNIMQDLGIGIGANYSDNNLRGEIEVFVSHKDHLTNWHYDFQHNFTIQLFGHKRWYLLPIDANNCSYFNVYRGNTPHYGNSNDSDLSAKECQFKLHRSESETFDFKKWKDFDIKQEYKNKIKVIDLKPGSVLYFPSGMWHKVETVSDQSLSINLSLVPLTYKELIGNAMTHYMSVNPEFRQPVLCNNIKETYNRLNSLCDKLKMFICNMQQYPSCVVPYSFSEQSVSGDNSVCVEMVDFEDNYDDENGLKPVKPPEITIDSCFVVNPLSVLIGFNDIYEEDKQLNGSGIQDLGERFCSFDDLEMKDEIEEDEDKNNEQVGDDELDSEIVGQYILHVNFGESDSFSSISRIIFQCKNEMTVKVIDWICDLRKKKETGKMVSFAYKDVKNVIDNNENVNDLCHVLRVFVFFGWLSIKSE